MRGRRTSAGAGRSRWSAGVLGLMLAVLALAFAGPAGAAARPDPSYHRAGDHHRGSDRATFTGTGVRDGNCPVPTGGRTVYLEPGGRVDFGSAAGIDVRAAVDGQRFSVRGGQRVLFVGLSQGAHTLTWTASGLRWSGHVYVTTSAAECRGGAVAKARPIALASSPNEPSGQLPVVLAILAVLTMAFVAGTYGRIYLLGRTKR